MAAGRSCRKCSACNWPRSMKRPTVVAQIDPLGAVPAPLRRRGAAARPATRWILPRAMPRPIVMDRLYRPQALDVPVLTSRDGPIAAINPRDDRRAGRCRRSCRGRRRTCRGAWVDDGAGRRRCASRALRFWPCARPGCGSMRPMARCCSKRSWMRRTLCGARAGSGCRVPHRQFGFGLFCRQRRDLWPGGPGCAMWSRISRCRPTRWPQTYAPADLTADDAIWPGRLTADARWPAAG